MGSPLRRPRASQPQTSVDEIEELAVSRQKFHEERQRIQAKQLEAEEKAHQNAEREQALLDELNVLETQIAELSERLQATVESPHEEQRKERKAEAASKRMAAMTMLGCERDWLQKEVTILKGQSSSLEEKVVQLSKQLEDAKASAARGAEETAQLRSELQERREEQASFAAQQAAHARTDAGLRLQASSLDHHVSRLVQAVEKEQDMQQKEQERLMKHQESHKDKAKNEHLRSEDLLRLPARLQADHEEAHRCKDLATELRHAKQECQAKLESYRGYQERLNFELVHWRQVSKQAEAELEAAKISRSKVEEELTLEEREVEELTKEVDRIEGKHLEALETKLLPLRESCAQLAERELQLVVQEQLDRHRSPSPLRQVVQAPPATPCSPLNRMATGIPALGHAGHRQCLCPAAKGLGSLPRAAPKPLPVLVGSMRRM